jgi:putative endonuclease
MKHYFIYIARCSDGTLYTGYCADLDARIQKHNEGKGAKYTKARRPIQLVYSEKFKTKSDAMKNEIAIKKLSRKAKEVLIQTQA